MKHFKFKRNSWHARLVEKYSPIETYWGEVNFCKYFWGVILGGISCIWIVCALSIFLYHFLVVPIIAIIISLKLNIIYFPDTIFVTFILHCGLIVLCLMNYLIKRRESVDSYIKSKRKKSFVKKNDSFFVAAYRKFKDKTCFRVELV